MPTITDEQVAAEARAMVRRMIEESGWYPKLRGEFRHARIEQDVDRMWHLMIADARKRLEQKEGAQRT